MQLIEFKERQKVVAVAKSFLGTPYHPSGRKKGIGVDCLTLLSEVYIEAGLIENINIPHYAPDFFKHKGTELYLQGLLKYTREIETPAQPGDIVLWKYGRCFSHGAIVVNWPHIIHSHVGRGCMMENIDNALWLKYIGENVKNTDSLRPTKKFSYWNHDGRAVRGRS